MRKKISYRLRLANLFLFVGVLASSIFFVSSCNPGGGTSTGYDTTIKNWINWNVRLSSHTIPSVAIQQVVAFYRDSLQLYDSVLIAIKNQDPSAKFTLTFRLDSCSCDRFLYNLKGDLEIQGSGSSVGSTPPPTNPPIKPGGGLAIVDDNDSLHNREPQAGPLTFSTGVVPINIKEIDTSKILAVIDSGIDSARFASDGLTRILWRGSGVAPTQRNFTGNGPVENFADDDHVRHGTAATAIALKQIDGRYPQLMVLKILDSNGTTSLFSATCALQYAITHGATIINASWGYYGKADSVLKSYIDDARRNAPTTLIIAAAGNDTLAHDPTQLCANGRISGRNTRLGTGGLFYYPACFSSKEGGNIISVTGLSSPTAPCIYQNFSDVYVQLGVVNSNIGPLPAHPCCSFHTEYLDSHFVMEGSSFATPVVSGKTMNFILRHGFHSINDYFTGIMVQRGPVGASHVTMDGQYLVY